MEPPTTQPNDIFTKLTALAEEIEMDYQSLESINLISEKQQVVFDGRTYTFDGQKKDTSPQLRRILSVLLREKLSLEKILPSSLTSTMRGLCKINNKITKDLAEVQRYAVLDLTDSAPSYLPVIETLLRNLILLNAELKKALRDREGISLIVGLNNTNILPDVIADFTKTLKTATAIKKNVSDLKETLEGKVKPLPPLQLHPLSFCLDDFFLSPLTESPESGHYCEERTSKPLLFSAFNFVTSNKVKKVEREGLNPSCPKNADSSTSDISEKEIDIAIDDYASLPLGLKKKFNEKLKKALATLLTDTSLPPDFLDKLNFFLKEFKVTLETFGSLPFKLQEKLNQNLLRIVNALDDFNSLPIHLRQKLKRSSQRVLMIADDDFFPIELSQKIHPNIKEIIISFIDAPKGSWVIGKNRHGQKICSFKVSDNAFISEQIPTT